MAHLVLITINDRCCLGARVLSSIAKQHNHKLSMIFFGEYNTRTLKSTCSISGDGSKNYFEDEMILLNLINELNPDVIGFSFRSISETIAQDLAKTVKRTFSSTPVIFGGIGPTSYPVENIPFADILCEGEGDYVLPAFLKTIDAKGTRDPLAFTHIPNLWIKSKGEIIKTRREKLVEDLDTVPTIDYTPEDKYSIVNGFLIRNDGRYDNEIGAYPLLTSRGCPYSCSYCHNSQIKKLYKGQRYCRRKSVENVIEELKNEKERNPDLKMISVYDDSFPDNKGWLKEFAPKYKSKIDLHYWCFVHPEFVTEENIKLLVDSHCGNICMGIQSFSEETLKLYKRFTPLKKIKEAFEVLSRHDIGVQIDLISFNPLEPEKDKRKTFLFLLNLRKNTVYNSPNHKQWYLSISRLTLFPHTILYDLIDKKEKATGEFKPYIEDPSREEFWEVMYKTAMHDYLPEESILNLSNNYEHFIKDFGNPSEEKAIEYCIRYLIFNRQYQELNKMNMELIRRIIQLNKSQVILDTVGYIESIYKKYEKNSEVPLSIYYSLTLLAENFIENNNYELAEFILTHLLTKNYSLLNTMNNLVVLQILTKRYLEARNAITEILRIDPGNKTALDNSNYLRSVAF